MKRASAALALGLALAAPRAAQNLPAQDPAQLEHALSVSAERIASFQQAWTETSPALRLEAAARLDKLGGRAWRQGGWPSDEMLDAAEAVLNGRTAPLSEPFASLQALADALDLQVRPGWIEPAATEGALPPALTVRIYPTRPISWNKSVEVRLVWIDGSVSEIARAEPVEAAALSAPGFEMYVRAPKTRRDALVLELASEGKSVRGRPLALGVVQRGLERLRQAVQPGPPDDYPRVDWTRVTHGLEQLWLLGVRGCFSRDPLRALGAMDVDRELSAPTQSGAPARYGERGGPRLTGPVQLRREGSAWWALQCGPSVDAVLVFPCAANQPIESLLYEGPSAREWERTGAGSGWLLLATPLLQVRPSSMRELLVEVRTALPGRPILLVARGEGGARAMLGSLAGPEWALDGLVLSQVDARIGPLWPAVPALLVCPPGAAASAPPAAAEVVSAEPSPFLNEIALPQLIHSWWTRVRPAPRVGSAPVGGGR